MIQTGKFMRGLICLLSFSLTLGLAVGCSKPLIPPEMEGNGGQSSDAGDVGGVNGGEDRFTDRSGLGDDSGRNDFGGSDSGIIDETVTETGKGVGEKGSGDGSDGSGDTGSTVFDSSFDDFNKGGDGTREAALDVFKPTNDLKDVYFAFDQYALTENTKSVLKENADWLKKNPGVKVEIQGHCDERGTNNYNLGLGERRALATKKYLVALGIEEDRLFTISYGEEKPFCFNSTKECWQDNRRGHFLVSE